MPGASGAFGAMPAPLSLHHGVVPATRNPDEPAPAIQPTGATVGRTEPPRATSHPEQPERPGHKPCDLAPHRSRLRDANPRPTHYELSGLVPWRSRGA
ncbi:hypothetical protein [Streptomyces sp. NPDC058751]|uniref:hypothetical protein n=1 Tax=Streptomyces sp. NPDC058751 TaxID=3346623 RepID=UPI00367620CF